MRFVFLGDAAVLSERLEEVREATGGRVAGTGFVDDATYRAYVDCADVAIQLRRRTRGETSRAVLDFMAAGVPTIVNAIGPFLDIDPGAVMRIAAAPDTADMTSAIASLLERPEARRRIGEAARDTIARENGPGPVMDAFVAGLRRVEGDLAQRDLGRRMDEIAAIAAEHGLDVDAHAALGALLRNLEPALNPVRLARLSRARRP